MVCTAMKVQSKSMKVDNRQWCSNARLFCPNNLFLNTLNDVIKRLFPCSKIGINITANSELTLFEAYEASNMIQEEAHEDANVIWGWVIDETMKDEARVTVIATGFEEAWLQQTPPVERRIREVMQGNGGRRNGRNTNMGGGQMTSGLSPDDYDIPTFFKNAD